MQVAAVIGDPVEHSLSPTIHTAAFDASDLDWRYVAFRVRPGNLPRSIDALRTLGVAGVSVTMPHKERVIDSLDRLDAAAETLGSVNTVAWEDEQLVGYSTDGDGLVDSLTATGVAVHGARIAVLGAGGAGRAIIEACGRHGAAEIVVVNRTQVRAESAALLASAASAGELSDIDDVDIIINATSIGMGAGSTGMSRPSDLPCPAEVLRTGQTVVDAVYHPLDTPLLRTARQQGATTVDGLWMLVYQAVRQQQIWTGRAPDPAVMRAAAEAELRRRQR